MRGLLFSWIAVACLGLGCCAALDAQTPAPPPKPAPEEKKPEPAPKGEEPKKIERDGSAQALHYSLAGIGVLIVLVLVCMPLRRE